MKYKTKSCATVWMGKPFTKRLPGDYPWKILGWLTEDLRQFLTIEDYKVISRITRDRDVASYLILGKEWGLQCMLTTGTNLLEKAAKYQLTALLKQFQFPGDKQLRKTRAIEKFKAGEDQCRLYNLEGYKRLVIGEEQWEVEAFTYAQDFLKKVLGAGLPDPSKLTDRSRHGPGATLDTEPGMVSSYFKFADWPYQCTRGARRHARNVIYHDERWLGALEDDYRTRFRIPKHVLLNRQVFWDTVLEVVDGNRIAFVPKNAEILRSIAIEPTMNLYLQLGVDGFIRKRLKRWGVDLDHQEKNQLLAYLGSKHWSSDDPFVTLDLANASNTISLGVCKWLLPQDWYDYLVELRSPSGNLEGEVISYEMISSMGNGYTFALESAIFTACIYAVTKATRGRVDPKDWAVFGDDLVIRKSLSDRLIRFLTNCGFEINVSKSFLEGPVRESCGCDWFQGSPVRPVFLDSRPNDVSELFVDVNRLKRILEVRWLTEESKTESGLDQWIPESCRDITGPYSDEEFDAYKHAGTPSSHYRHAMYKHKRLVRKPMKVKESLTASFHFRKLMHDLNPSPPPINKWHKGVTGSGDRFRVTRRNADSLSVSTSAVSHWQREYKEYVPAGSTLAT